METWIVRFVWNGPFLMCEIFKLAITKFHQCKCWSSYHFYVVILQHWNLSFHSFMWAFSIIHTFAISNYSSFHFIVLLHLIFFTFILIRIYLQWSSYPISIGHPSVIFTQMKFLPLLFNSFGTVFCCTIFWICFCGNFFCGNYNIFDLQQLILLFIFYLKSLCTDYVMRTV